MLPQVPGVRGLLRGSSHPTLIRKWFPHHELCFENCNIQHNVQLKLAFHTEPPSPKFLYLLKPKSWHTTFLRLGNIGTGGSIFEAGEGDIQDCSGFKQRQSENNVEQYI